MRGDATKEGKSSGKIGWQEHRGSDFYLPGGYPRLLAKTRVDKKASVVGHKLLYEIAGRLQFLIQLGLDYLTLDRSAVTLSGGEAQRVRLATQLGSSLAGVLYILDEPSIGLHQKDNAQLVKLLKQLRDSGNSIVVV